VDVAGPLKQPVPETITTRCCGAVATPRGGYLCGGWSDWMGFPCPKCGKSWFWQPDKPPDDKS
jgi:hypothetical protein